MNLPPHLQAYADRLPTLPSNIDEAEAAFWCVSTILQAKVAREWSGETMRDVLLILLASSLGNLYDDDERLIADLRQQLAALRADDATKRTLGACQRGV